MFAANFPLMRRSRWPRNPRGGMLSGSLRGSVGNPLPNGQHMMRRLMPIWMLKLK